MKVCSLKLKFQFNPLTGAIHASDLERLFQIAEWMKEDSIKQLRSTAQIDALTARFIEGAADEESAAKVKAAISRSVVQKYTIVIKNFENCPKAWKKLEQHYDQYGEESKLKMNAMYGAFKKLSDEGKLMAIDKVEKDEIRTGGIKIVGFYLTFFVERWIGSILQSATFSSGGLQDNGKVERWEQTFRWEKERGS